ncbi:MAG: xylulokinase [Edaphobacter sp.]|uniref:xylulokinase n=1 Tax=Edaphobacter sp. TaxID=1934404 RepID=UPI00238DB78F|nr:xylulokinase [Edaphobacter sp.]MDE1175800.1 xylulokinase [Edaphobacter sp.]
MYLGIDCGTQGTKALLIDEAGVAAGRGYAPHALIERENGRREQEPRWWVEALKASVQQALAAAGRNDVQAIGISGQQHGLVVLDDHFEVIRPAKLWNDTETAKQNAEIVAMLGGPQAMMERFGILPLTGYTVSKLLWLKQVEPENFARVRHILLPHEYLNFWLTGQMCAEYGDASGTAYFDPRTRTWAREILDAIDGGSGQLFAALPKLIQSDEIVGTVLPEIAAELGISEGCVVSPGGGDNMMGAIGTGNVRDGVVTLSLGTSSTVYTHMSAPSTDRSGNVAPFCASSDGWLPLVCTMNATNVVTQTLQVLGRTVADIEPALEATMPGAGGLTFLPFLHGERTPDLPEAKGSLVGISANNFTPENLVRAVIEGVSFGVLEGLNLILEGKKAEVIYVIGGGSKSNAWRQLLADATGAVIEVPVEEEAGSLGAAIQAMQVASVHSGAPVSYEELAQRMVKVAPGRTMRPNAERAAGYDAARNTYRRRLKELYFSK